MRIGQLARKLNVTPTQIIQYLTELGIETDKGVNTKLVQGGIDKVMERFDMNEGLSVEEEVDSELVEKTAHEEAKDVEPIESVVMEEEVTEEEAEVVDTDIMQAEAEEEEPVEVIKPNLVKLQGLKVMGKIELPEPKNVKPAPEGEGEGESNDSGETTKKPRYEDRSRRKSERFDSRRKPKVLSYEEKLKREEQQLKRKLREEENARKRKKQKAYEEKLRQASRNSPKKLKKQVEVVENKPVAKKIDKPKSVWGRFKKWLNT